MADVPQRSKRAQSPNSLAEMAAKAAQRSVSNRPPPPPLQPPSGHASFPPQGLRPPSYVPPAGYGQQPGHASNRTGGSGLIHLNNLQTAPNGSSGLRDVNVQHLSAPPISRRAALESNPFESKGSRGGLVGFIVGLLVIAGAYGLAVKRGINPIAVGRSFITQVRNWDSPPPPPITPIDTQPRRPKRRSGPPRSRPSNRPRPCAASTRPTSRRSERTPPSRPSRQRT